LDITTTSPILSCRILDTGNIFTKGATSQPGVAALDRGRYPMDGGSLGWPTWIGVVANDLEAQRRFYRDVLKLREVGSGEGWVHFDLDGHMFEVIQREVTTAQYDKARYQVGFTVDDIEAIRAELIEHGVQQITEIEPDPGSDTANRWAYFRDPEGNVFEITQWIRR
jgi:catechol 2,3-dioxygenase-like lactoylglutathione lyase family enzyme